MIALAILFCTLLFSLFYDNSMHTSGGVSVVYI